MAMEDQQNGPAPVVRQSPRPALLVDQADVRAKVARLHAHVIASPLERHLGLWSDHSVNVFNWARPSSTSGSWRSVKIVEEDRLDVEGNRDLVAHHHATARQFRGELFGVGLCVTEPALDPAGTELDLVGGESLRGSFKAARGFFSAHECDVNAGNLVVAELQVAHPVTVVLH
jgi:hypothetical protein